MLTPGPIRGRRKAVDARRFQRGAPGYGQNVRAAELKQKLSLAAMMACARLVAARGAGDAAGASRGAIRSPISSRCLPATMCCVRYATDGRSPAV